MEATTGRTLEGEFNEGRQPPEELIGEKRTINMSLRNNGARIVNEWRASERYSALQDGVTRIKEAVGGDKSSHDYWGNISLEADRLLDDLQAYYTIPKKMRQSVLGSFYEAVNEYNKTDFSDIPDLAQKMVDTIRAKAKPKQMNF